MPITVTALLIRIIDAFKVVDIIMVLTGGGPGQSTESVTLAIYRTGVKGGDLAFGSSQAYFLLVVMLIFGGWLSDYDSTGDGTRLIYKTTKFYD